MEPVALAKHTVADDGGQDPVAGGGWAEVCEVLRGSVGEDAFQRWFRSAAWAGEDNGVGCVTVPGEIHQVWIETNYLPELTMAVNRIFDGVREVTVTLAGNPEVAAAATNGHHSHAPAQPRHGKTVTLDGDALERVVRHHVVQLR